MSLVIAAIAKHLLNVTRKTLQNHLGTLSIRIAAYQERIDTHQQYHHYINCRYLLTLYMFIKYWSCHEEVRLDF